MTIKIYDGQPTGDDTARRFIAYAAEADTPRGQYDETIDLIVHDATGYVDRDELRAVAQRHCQRKLNRSHATDLTVRRIERLRARR
jgi:hypothetical protein